MSVRHQFAKAISAVVTALRLWKPSLTRKSGASSDSSSKNDLYVHMVNALCWSYRSEDHEWLVKLDLFDAMLRGDGETLHPLRSSWGRDHSQLRIISSSNTSKSLPLPAYLWQALAFITAGI